MSREEVLAKLEAILIEHTPHERLGCVCMFDLPEHPKMAIPWERHIAEQLLSASAGF